MGTKGFNARGGDSREDNVKCFKCGEKIASRDKIKNHLDKCRGQNVNCNVCGKRGNFGRCCRSNTSSTANLLEEEGSEQEDDQEEQQTQGFPIYQVNEISVDLLRSKMLITIEIDGKMTEFVLDTGSPFTILNQDLYKEILKKKRIKKTKKNFTDYNGNPIPMGGYVECKARYRGMQIPEGKAYVSSQKNAPDLLGLEWILGLRIGIWPQYTKEGKFIAFKEFPAKNEHNFVHIVKQDQDRPFFKRTNR